MTINYREAVLQDEEQLFMLALQFTTSFIVERSDFAQSFASILKDTNADLFVAERESKLIGYVMAFHHRTFYANGTVSWVEEIFVTDEFRRMDIGNSMMRIIEQKALARGSKLVALATRRAHSFYTAIGYEESATYYKKTFSNE